MRKKSNRRVKSQLDNRKPADKCNEVRPRKKVSRSVSDFLQMRVVLFVPEVVMTFSRSLKLVALVTVFVPLFVLAQE